MMERRMYLITYESFTTKELIKKVVCAKDINGALDWFNKYFISAEKIIAVSDITGLDVSKLNCNVENLFNFKMEN